VDTLKEFGTGLSAQDTRVARSFAVAALAGELAIEWGVLPWPPRSSLLAAIEIFKHWQATQPKSAQSKEHADILKNISDFIGAFGDTRFTDVKPKTFIDYTDPANPVLRKCEEQPMPKGVNRAGYWDDSSGSRIYLLSPPSLLEAGKYDTSRIVAALELAGAFAAVGTDGHKAKRKRTPDGRNTRFYWINTDKLDTTP
jgi:putative DNA primase/helicase